MSQKKISSYDLLDSVLREHDKCVTENYMRELSRIGSNLPSEKFKELINKKATS